MEKILLIEDDANLSQALQVYFEGEGYLVIGTMSGEKGLKWLEGPEKPALIICDIGLPDMNGLDVCKKIKSDMKMRKIPIIVLTGRTDNATRLAATSDSAANLYLTKPVEFSELLKAVKSLISRHKQEDSLLKNIYMKKFDFKDPRGK